jgi:hypothetical protein
MEDSIEEEIIQKHFLKIFFNPTNYTFQRKADGLRYSLYYLSMYDYKNYYTTKIINK